MARHQADPDTQGDGGELGRWSCGGSRHSPAPQGGVHTPGGSEVGRAGALRELPGLCGEDVVCLSPPLPWPLSCFEPQGTDHGDSCSVDLTPCALLREVFWVPVL